MSQPIDLRDVLKQARRLTKRGPSDKQLKPEDYDIAIGDLDNPEEIIRTMRSRMERAVEARQSHEEGWRRAFMAWMQKLDTEKEDGWESKRFLPMILQHVETALPNVTSAVFNRRRVFQCVGETPEGIHAAEALEQLIDNQVRSQTNIEPAFDRCMWYSTLFGTGYLDTSWSLVRETRPVPTVVVDTDKDGEAIMTPEGFEKKVKVIREIDTIVEDFPVVRAPSPLDVWNDPYAEVGDDSNWHFEHQITTIDKLRRAAGNGHIDAKAVEDYVKWRKERGITSITGAEDGVWGQVDTRIWDGWLTEAGLSQRPEDIVEDFSTNDQDVAILVYRSKQETVTLVQGDRMIGYSKNPYIHGKTGLVTHQMFPVPGSPYGRGLGTVLLGHQELVNENMNRYMDVAALTAMAPIIVNRNSIGVMDKTFTWQPNKLIPARDVNNAAKRLELPPPTNVALQIDQHLKRDADDTSGFGEQARGLATPGVGTATEFTGLQQNIATRAYMHVRRLQQTMSQVGTLLMQLNQQFMTEAQVIRVVGQKGLDYVQVQPWEIVGKVKVTCTADPNRASPEIDAQQLIGAIQVSLPLLTGQAGPAGPKLVKMLLESIGVDDKDLNEILPAEESKADPLLENVALESGYTPAPSPSEDFATHMQIHGQRLAELEAEGASPQLLARFQEHMQMTMQMAQEVGAQQAGGGADVQNPQPDATQGGSPGQVQGQAQGAGGVPGAASPGPAAPAGRPL